MSINVLRTELEKKFNPAFVKELLLEYKQSRECHWLGDITKTIIHAARFSELCMACLKQLSDSTVRIDLNRIAFGSYFDDLLRLPKQSPEEEVLYALIPKVLKGIYTIRSKKRVAHMKITTAEAIDAEYVITACNWVMSQLIFLYMAISPEDVVNLTNSIMERKVPTIEQFEDGEMMVLKKGLSFNEELLLVLYQFPKRMSRKELNLMLKPKKSSYVATYLNLLYKDRLIHLNKDGAVINKNGIKEIEDNRKKYFL